MQRSLPPGPEDTGETAMMRGHRYYRKPDPLLLLVAAVALGVVTTTVVNAGERDLFATAALSASQFSVDQGMVGTDIGTRGARLQVSLSPPPEVETSLIRSGASERDLDHLSSIFLSLYYPW
jgi:hypothetical protein